MCKILESIVEGLYIGKEGRSLDVGVNILSSGASIALAVSPPEGTPCATE